MRYENNENDALEVLNSAFIKVLQNLSSYDSDYPIIPWIRRVTVNVAIDRFRQKKRRRQIMENPGDGLEQMSGYDTASGVEVWEESERLQHLLGFLKEAERTVFNLYAIDGYSHKEIAASMGLTERSSIRHLTNARRKLQSMLEGSEIRIKKA